MVTTIKLHEKTKLLLDAVKQERQSYDDAIADLLNIKKKENLRKHLIRAYSEKNSQEKDEFEEWDAFVL